MSIQQLPKGLVASFLGELDGSSFLAARSTCKRWLDVTRQFHESIIAKQAERAYQSGAERSTPFAQHILICREVLFKVAALALGHLEKKVEIQSSNQRVLFVIYNRRESKGGCESKCLSVFPATSAAKPTLLKRKLTRADPKAKWGSRKVVVTAIGVPSVTWRCICNVLFSMRDEESAQS